jgi:tetratricopeptide (TPR) repeat protein
MKESAMTIELPTTLDGFAELQAVPENMQELLRDYVSNGLFKELDIKRSDLRGLLNVAKRKLQEGNHFEAFQIYCGLVTIDPGNPKYHLGLANCAVIIEHYDLALYGAALVVAMRPQFPLGYLLCGQACLGLGSVSEAREYLETAMRLAEEAADHRVAVLSKALLAQYEVQ